MGGFLNLSAKMLEEGILGLIGVGGMFAVCACFPDAATPRVFDHKLVLKVRTCGDIESDLPVGPIVCVETDALVKIPAAEFGDIADEVDLVPGAGVWVVDGEGDLGVGDAAWIKVGIIVSA